MPRLLFRESLIFCPRNIIFFHMYTKESNFPGSTAIQLERKSEACNTRNDDVVLKQDFGKSWRDFPRAMLNLVSSQLQSKPRHGVHRRLISVVIICIFEIIIFCFIVAICDLDHAVEAMYGHLEIFSEI